MPGYWFTPATLLHPARLPAAPPAPNFTLSPYHGEETRALGFGRRTRAPPGRLCSPWPPRAEPPTGCCPVAKATSAPGQPRPKPQERIQPTRFKCLLLSATAITPEKTFQRVKGTIAVKSMHLTKAKKEAEQVLGGEARGGPGVQEPWTSLLRTDSTSALRPGPQRGQTPESWTRIDVGRCPSIPASGGQPRADAGTAIDRADGVREATGPRVRSGARTPRTCATRPGWTHLTQFQRVRDSRERELGTLCSAPSAAQASSSRRGHWLLWAWPGLRPGAPPPRACPHLPRCNPHAAEDMRLPRAGHDSAAPPAVPRPLCVPARPALCLPVAPRSAWCRPEAALYPAFPLGMHPSTWQRLLPSCYCPAPSTLVQLGVLSPAEVSNSLLPRASSSTCVGLWAAGPVQPGCSSFGLFSRLSTGTQGDNYKK